MVRNVKHFHRRLEKREQEVVQAKEVKQDIEDIRNNFLDNSKARIERIVKDLRVAMEYSSAQLLKEVNKKVYNLWKTIAFTPCITHRARKSGFAWNSSWVQSDSEKASL